MSCIIFATIAALAGVSFGVQPAKAYEAPSCAVIETGIGAVSSATGTT